MRLHSKYALKSTLRSDTPHIVEITDIQKSVGKGGVTLTTVIYSKHKRPFSLDEETFGKLYESVPTLK